MPDAEHVPRLFLGEYIMHVAEHLFERAFVVAEFPADAESLEGHRADNFGALGAQ